MSFIPQDELKGSQHINLAPMIDFLFLMVVFFATLAVSRVTTRDTEIDLVKIDTTHKEAISYQAPEEFKLINILVTEERSYKWITEIRDYVMDTPEEIGRELRVQYQRGILPEDKAYTKILLKIDRKAEWEPIMKLIFAIKEEGFDVRPLYEPEEEPLTETS